MKCQKPISICGQNSDHFLSQLQPIKASSHTQEYIEAEVTTVGKTIEDVIVLQTAATFATGVHLPLPVDKSQFYSKETEV